MTVIMMRFRELELLFDLASIAAKKNADSSGRVCIDMGDIRKYHRERKKHLATQHKTYGDKHVHEMFCFIRKFSSQRALFVQSDNSGEEVGYTDREILGWRCDHLSEDFETLSASFDKKELMETAKRLKEMARAEEWTNEPRF